MCAGAHDNFNPNFMSDGVRGWGEANHRMAKMK
jgi:hypothetical protein